MKAEIFDNKINDWFIDKQVRNTTNNDPLLDWLDLYGETKGYKKDVEEKDYHPDLEFSTFIGEYKKKFLDHCLNYMLQHLHNFKINDTMLSPIVQICESSKECDQVQKYIDTIAAMKLKFPVIVKGVLHDDGVICQPELLIENSFIKKLFPKNEFENCLYHIVHPRYALLELSVKNPFSILPSSSRYHETLLYVQTLTLKNVLRKNKMFSDDYIPIGYVLGRGWKCGEFRNNSAFDILGEYNYLDRANVISNFNKAKEWFKKLKSGSNWILNPPSVQELYPNMKNHHDSPWSTVKANLAKELKELTLLWNVGVVHRNMAIMRGKQTYDHPTLMAKDFAMEDGKIYQQVDRFLNAMRSQTITLTDTLKHLIHDDGKLFQVFADFETIPALSDSFVHFPYVEDTTMIGMIGFRYYIPEGTNLKEGMHNYIYTAKRATKQEEAKLIDRWLSHIKLVSEILGYQSSTITNRIVFPKGKTLEEVKHLFETKSEEKVDEKVITPFKCYIWSRAEENFLQKNYNSAAKRHNRDDWKENIVWCDIHAIIKSEGITIPGSFNFSLKSVTKALYNLKLVDTIWAHSPIENGMRAAVALLRCAEESKVKNIDLDECYWMNIIKDYLNIDTYAVYNITQFLRKKR